MPRARNVYFEWCSGHLHDLQRFHGHADRHSDRLPEMPRLQDTARIGTQLSCSAYPGSFPPERTRLLHQQFWPKLAKLSIWSTRVATRWKPAVERRFRINNAISELWSVLRLPGCRDARLLDLAVLCRWLQLPIVVRIILVAELPCRTCSRRPRRQRIC